MIEERTLPQIVDLSKDEIYEVLESVSFGHIAFSADDRPYVIPIHFAVQKPYVYFFTTEGKKTEIMEKNPYVCLQVEDIADSKNWKSVIVEGEGKLLTDTEDIEKAMNLIQEANPTLTPAWSIRWMDSWIRANRSAVYQIQIYAMSGRRTLERT